MSGLTSGITKNFIAETAVTKHRICKFGSSDTAVVQAAAVGDSLIGVSTEIDAAAGQPCDVRVTGVALVEAGGNITRGGPITSDANGKAVAAAPAAGANNRIIGHAHASAVAGDIFPVHLSMGSVQG